MQEPKQQKTKTALLRAAERLFAEKGLGRVTGKDILRAAGARNESALQYHFGDMHALMKEVFENRFRKIEASRIAGYAALDEQGRGNDFEALIRASIAPLFEACLEDDGRLYARFCIQFSTDPAFDLPEVIEEFDANSVLVLRERLVGSLGHLPPEVMISRLQLGFSISLMQMAAFARRIEADNAPPLDEAINEAAAGLCGYLRAPPLDH